MRASAVAFGLCNLTEKRMVWEGVAAGRLKKKNTNEKMRANINAGIQEMFAGYPFRAGQQG